MELIRFQSKEDCTYLERVFEKAGLWSVDCKLEARQAKHSNSFKHALGL